MIFRALICTFGLFSSVLVSGQTPSNCSPITLVSAPQLTFSQRACFYGEQLITPMFALQAGFSAAFGEFRNSPHMRIHDPSELPQRFGAYYASHAARNTGEMLAGYLHHEDPRFRASGAKGFLRRTDLAFLSVLTSPDENGRLRVAYGPIAGSLSGAFVGTIMYGHTETLGNVAMHAGIIYSGYMLRAFFREFKPEMYSYTRHILRHEKG